ncbi:MAG: hypothetical protein FJ104_02690 [Deltaproteobacteria bacterium]|nr:hypothetical protein [Deltaproteobacteria bacterium]
MAHATRQGSRLGIALVILRTVSVLAVSAGALWSGLRRVWAFTIDDAGIAQAYATRLSMGQGFRAVAGGPTVEGYSDFLWVALLTVSARLGLDLDRASKWLGAALLVGACAAAAWLLRSARRSPEPGLAFTDALPPVFLALCPDVVVWVPSGLENALLWALSLLALALDAAEAKDPSRRPWSAVACVGVALTRPEGVVYAGILALAKAASAARSPAHRPQLRSFVLWLGAPLLAYHLVHFAVFRELVPNTFYAKAPGTGKWAEKGLAYVKAGGLATAAWALGPAALLSLLAGPRLALPLLCTAGFALSFAVYSRGDWMPHHRFVGLAMPTLATAAALGIDALGATIGRLSRRAAWGSVLASVLALGAAALWERHHRPRFANPMLSWCHLCQRRADATALRDGARRAGAGVATLLTHDFGGPASLSSREFRPIDFLGLCDAAGAALLHRSGRGAFPELDAARYSYFFHEQPRYPTLVYLPDHFFPAFGESPEARFGYLALRAPTAKGARPVATYRLHRGAVVDFYPPVSELVFRRAGERFVVVGWSLERRGGDGELLARVSLVQPRPGGDPATLRLGVGGASGTAIRAVAGDPGLLSELRSDEPFVVSVAAPVAPGTPPDAKVTLTVQDGRRAAVEVDLGRLSSARAEAIVAPPLPFPGTLRGPEDATLASLGWEVRALAARRAERHDLTLPGGDLATRLVAAADAAVGRGAVGDAYLALVWAVQVEPDLQRDLHRRIGALRPHGDRGAFLEERALLGQFYREGEPLLALELALLLAEHRLWDQARHLLGRLPAGLAAPSGALWTAAVEATLRAIEAREPTIPMAAAFQPAPPPGIDGDFDGDQASGWQLGEGPFRPLADASLNRPLVGQLGRGALSSQGHAKDGEALSNEFVVGGRALSFRIAGGRDTRGLAVELVIDGAAVHHATGPRSRAMTPVFWDLRPHAGKRARLRLVDRSHDRELGFVAIDRLRLHPDPGAPPPLLAH